VTRPSILAPRRRGPVIRSSTGVVVLAVLLLLFPLADPSSRNLSFGTSVLVFGIGATGLGLMWGQAGQLSVAHGAVMGVGAYVAAILGTDHDLTFVQTLPIALVAGALCGGFVSLFAFRTSGHYFIVLTFAIGEVAVVLARRLESITGGLNGITMLPGDQEAFGFELNNREDFYRLTASATIASLLVALAVMHSKWGVSLRGMRENVDLAKSMGMNIGLHRSLIFMLGGIFAALAGQLLIYQVKFVDPATFSLDTSIFFVLMALLGGRGHLVGPLIGAAVYILLPEFIFLSPVQSQMVLGLALIVLILVLPEGLLSLGAWVRGRVEDRGDARRTDAVLAHGLAVEREPDGSGDEVER
jgi:branched-chain amino acid transport system permease protein